MNRNLKDCGWLMLKGIAMGAADVVPGVSGGTIAFIAGIYEKLVESIKSISPKTFKLLFTSNIADFWKAVNGNFLLSIASGIAISIFSLAKLITYLMDVHSVMVWAFFFGLVLASTYFVSKDIGKWNRKTVSSFVAGAATAFYITMATPTQTPDALWFIFLCGFVAICAMILPGISGSFILLLLGKYAYVMEAVKNLDIVVLLVFAAGAAMGITLFSRVLSWTLRRFHDVSLAVLTGFMAGSLNKVWPWKNAAEGNILPDAFPWQAIGLAVLGFALVFILEKLSVKKKSFAA